MHRAVTAVLTVASLTFLPACSSSSIDADDAVFAGLPGAVVTEVLANPKASSLIEQEPEATRASLAQGIVRNFLFCREALRVYQQWVTTGQAPTPAPLAAPTTPLEPSNGALVADYSRFTAAVTSGEPQKVRQELTSEGSCGTWIPATPGDVSGPTIRDVVEKR